MRALKDGENLELQGRIARGMNDVPVARIYEQFQFIENSVLPAIEAKHGKQSEQYKTYKAVLNTLLWCITVIDRDERNRRDLVHFRTLLQFYIERCEHLETELQKYTSLEDLLLSQTLETYSTAIKKRCADLLTKK
jgi:hypothetical protein